jgi:hypothetical protein
MFIINNVAEYIFYAQPYPLLKGMTFVSKKIYILHKQ